MKAVELAQRAGVSRQWLSKMAQCGLIPDASRLPNGRWSYANTPALRAWIKQAEVKNAADKRRTLTKHAREATRLRGLMARSEMTMARAKHIRARLDELATRTGPWSIWDIAEDTGWSVRSIQRTAKDIPGAVFEGGKFQFARTAELADWLSVQRGRFQARRRGMRQAKHLPTGRVDLDHIRYLRALPHNLSWQMRAAFNVEKARLPLWEWGTEHLQSLLDDVELNARVICEELQAELERRRSGG